MSSAAPARSAKDATSKNKPLVPPDEKFWVRYSPHYEFPLSSISSFALHVLVLGVAALLAMVILPRFGQAPMELDSVSLLDGGGGGSPDGIGGGPGKGVSGESQEQSLPVDPTKRYEEKQVEKVDLPTTTTAAPILPDISEQDLARLIEENNKAVQSIKDLPKTTRDKLTEGLVPGKGQGGPGKGGGKGTGTGTGEGPGSGPGKGTMNDRIRRMLRWTMLFNTRDGTDYANQLKSIGAILCVESAEDPQKGIIYERIERPAKGEVRDLNSFNCIWWIDDKPESVSALARALSISPTPQRFIAFLPRELEDKLTKMEHDFKGRSEADIKETIFELRRSLDGRYEPRVREQIPMGGKGK